MESSIGGIYQTHNRTWRPGWRRRRNHDDDNSDDDDDDNSDDDDDDNSDDDDDDDDDDSDDDNSDDDDDHDYNGNDGNYACSSILVFEYIEKSICFVDWLYTISVCMFQYQQYISVSMESFILVCCLSEMQCIV